MRHTFSIASTSLLLASIFPMVGCGRGRPWNNVWNQRCTVTSVTDAPRNSAHSSVPTVVPEMGVPQEIPNGKGTNEEASLTLPAELKELPSGSSTDSNIPFSIPPADISTPAEISTPPADFPMPVEPLIDSPLIDEDSDPTDSLDATPAIRDTQL